MRVELTKNLRGEDRFEIKLGDSLDDPVYVEYLDDAEKLARWIFELLPGGDPLTAMREARDVCALCGLLESNSKHIRYGPDLDNPVKHEFVRKAAGG